MSIKGDKHKGEWVKYNQSSYFCDKCGKGPSACKCKNKKRKK